MSESELEDELRRMTNHGDTIRRRDTMVLLFGIRFASELKDSELRDRLAQRVLGRKSGNTIQMGCKLAPYVTVTGDI